MARYSDRDWAEAQRRCRLTDDDVRKARELGMTPKSLTKNVPSPTQQWKAPVADWVRSLHASKFGSRKLKLVSNSAAAGAEVNPEPPPETPPASKPISIHSAGLFSLGPEVDSEDYDPDDEQTELSDPFERHQTLHEETAETEAGMYRRQEQFRIAAEYVARAFAQLPEVQKVELFGSVASKLKKEIPRFSRLRKQGVRIAHECTDVDLYVYLTRLDNLKALQRARARALNLLLAERDIGIPPFQVDVHILDPETGRYRGRLCDYGQCPKGKDACWVAGCGAQPFLRLFTDYQFDRLEFFDTKRIVLFERTPETGGITPEPGGITDDDVPF